MCYYVYMPTGKIIAIEGTDASGKGTQSQLLVDYLQSKEVPTEYIDFPQYYDNFYGKMVARFLNGEFGELEECHPHLISVVYALDRLESKPVLTKWLNEGKVVVINRYVGSNMAHQSAKLSPSKWNDCIAMIEKMEFEVNAIPREDLVLFLHVPTVWSQSLVDAKGDRGYLHGKKRDIAEDHEVHQQLSEQVFLKIVEDKQHWEKISCVTNEVLRDVEDIHEEVVSVVEGKLQI